MLDIAIPIILLEQALADRESDLKMDWPNKDTLDLKERLDAERMEQILEIRKALKILRNYND